MSVCSTCRGYGLARGGSCWTCGGSGSSPAPVTPERDEVGGPVVLDASLVRWLRDEAAKNKAARGQQQHGAHFVRRARKLNQAADRIDALLTDHARQAEELAELRAAKWQVRHVDTMNDMVSQRMIIEDQSARIAELEALGQAYDQLRAPTQSGTGEGLTRFGPEIAYGALWRTIGTNPRLHEARRILLRVVGGQASDGQRRGVQWAVHNLGEPSEAEIAQIDDALAQPTRASGGEELIDDEWRALFGDTPDSFANPGTIHYDEFKSAVRAILSALQAQAGEGV